MFCDNCGARFASAPPGTAPTAPRTVEPATSPSPMAERRQLTVMFCDIADSVGISTRVDPEDLRDVLAAYQAECGAVIDRFGGHIAQYLGDGILVYFGYPEAHEDDAARAVRAGLEIVAAVATLDARLRAEKGVHLSVRVGIHTGIVVVGDVGSGASVEQLALGETPNVAARIQSIAAVNCVLISDVTHRLAQSQVTTEPIGVHALKGMAKPLVLYKALGATKAPAPQPEDDSAARTRLVGRQSEVLLLQNRWAQVIEGTGQVVSLSGEAGIGKSRLIQVLRSHAAHAGGRCLGICGSAYHQSTALHPVVDLLHGLLRFERSDEPLDRLARLRAGLAELEIADERVSQLLAALLSLPSEGSRESASTQKEMLEAILAILLAVANRDPVLLIVEDLHWFDPSTIELLGLLIDQVPTANMLLLLASRPTFEPPWGGRPHINALRLGRLTRAEVGELVLQVTGGKPLPVEILEQIALKTDGVPLFVEELTKTVLELGLVRDHGDHYVLEGPLLPLAIPATVHDSLMARLDRLSTAKTVAQLASVLGRGFSYELLHAVARIDEATLKAALQQLVSAEVLYQKGVPPSATYTFKHALVQDAAYGSLLRGARYQFHRTIALTLVDRFPDSARAEPAVLAHHYTEAGMAPEAIPCWKRAAELSVRHAAHREAISQFTSAQALLESLPAGPERSRQELDILLGLGPALMTVRGYASVDVERNYERARVVAGALGEARQRLPVLFGLWRYYLNRGRLQTARELAEELVGFADEASGASPLIGYYALGTTRYYQGEAEPALEHFDRVASLYDPSHDWSQSPTDLRVASLSCGAAALWHLGHADRALDRCAEAIELARSLSHMPSLAHALYFGATLHYFRREPGRARERVQALMACSTERGFAHWEVRGAVLLGWVMVEEGEVAQGIATILRAIEAQRAIGAELAMPNFLGALAEAYLKSGEIAAGLSVVNDALMCMERTGERRWEVELRRLKAELLVAEGNAALAEAELRQAIAVARSQHARPLELRAAMSLLRLERMRDRHASTTEFAAICGALSEGLDTPDFRDASRLLATT